jgi:hypothetical protein
MIKELGAHADNFWAIASTCLSFSIFLIVVVYLATDRRKKHHQRMESLPLEDGALPAVELRAHTNVATVCKDANHG